MPRFKIGHMRFLPIIGVLLTFALLPLINTASEIEEESDNPRLTDRSHHRGGPPHFDRNQRLTPPTREGIQSHAGYQISSTATIAINTASPPV